MPKYRSLTLQELQALETEFVNYLILNGIMAEDWEKLKKEDQEKAEKIIDLFSDVVFESIFRKTEYLEYRVRQEVQTFQCLQEKLVIVGMKSEDGQVDFTDNEFIQKAMLNPPKGLKVYTSEKVYSKERELELFEMTETGCVISDGKLFKTLCLVLPN